MFVKVYRLFFALPSIIKMNVMFPNVHKNDKNEL